MRNSKTVELTKRFMDELVTRRLTADTKVMSCRELAKYFSISPVTADRILNELEKQDVVYRIPGRGTFVKHDPPVIPAIAYAGKLPEPGSTDPIKRSAAELLLKHFAEINIEPEIIPYHILCNPRLAEKRLRNINGLLIDASCIDEKTLPVLWGYRGRIVAAGNLYMVDELPCSQVLPDYTHAMLKFHEAVDFAHYSRILVISAEHRNSVACAESVCRILNGLQIPEEKIEIQYLPTANSASACWTGLRCFSEDQKLDRNTLIISMSDYFSQGISGAFRDRECVPDILSFDNLDAYDSSFNSSSPWLGSIDRCHGTVWKTALDLLCSQVRSQSEQFHIIKVPAGLVMRNNIKNNKHQPNT